MEISPQSEVQVKPLLFSAAIVRRYDITLLPITFTYEGSNISFLAKNIKKIISSALEIKEEDIKESTFNLSRGEKETLRAEYRLNKLIDNNCYYRFEISIFYEVDINDVGKFECSIRGSLYLEIPQETSFQRSVLYHFFFSLFWNLYYSEVIKKYIEHGKEYINKLLNLLRSRVKV